MMERTARVVAEKHYLQVTEEHFQKAVQQPAAIGRIALHEQQPSSVQVLNLQGNATSRDSLPHNQMGDKDLETCQKTTGKTAFSKTGGAESGAVGARGSDLDPALWNVATAWQTLSEVTRQVIV